MKLNEKNVINFALSNSPIDKEGTLLKRGEVNKNFQKRYFILKGNLLFYFERKGDKEPLGVIILEGCSVELAENDSQYTFQIVFHGARTRFYILSAEDQESLEEWMKALACASYEYIKLMVSELQRQVDELTQNDIVHSRAVVNSEDNLLGAYGGTDLQFDDASTSSKKSDRVNPFNRDDDTETLASKTNSIFYSSASQELIQPASVDITHSPNLRGSRTLLHPNPPPPRNFKQMHEDFGALIQQNIQERQDSEPRNFIHSP